MKPRERVELALNHQKPDRCPVQMGYTPEFYLRLRTDLQIKFGDEPDVEFMGIVNGDMRIASVGWSTSYYMDDKPYTDEWGVGWAIQPYQTPFGSGHYTEICSHPLADDSTLENYQPPNPNRPELYELAIQLVSTSKTEYWIVGQVHTTIFETAWALRGLKQILIDFAKHPGKANQILDIPYHYHLTAAKKLVEIGVDMIFLGDDVGTQTNMMISPQMWRDYLKPRMAEFVSALKSINPELKIAYHTDGNVLPIIAELIEIGIDVLNPIQPACMDPAEIKQEFGEQLCFWGTIDEQYTLPFGSPEDVANEVDLRLKTVGKGGGLILAPTHAIQLDTPLENFYSLVETIIDESD